jgi:Ca2+-binding EF-hand superfamily protein
MKKIIIITSALLITTVCQAAQTVSDKNISNWQQTRFTQLDTDKNDSLNLSELRATTEGWMTKAGHNEEKKVKQTKKKFTRIDKNKDHKISLQEFSDFLNETKKKA